MLNVINEASIKLAHFYLWLNVKLKRLYFLINSYTEIAILCIKCYPGYVKIRKYDWFMKIYNGNAADGPTKSSLVQPDGSGKNMYRYILYLYIDDWK